MKRFAERHPGPELMDQPDLPAADLKLNLQELETINRLLGGHNCTFHGLKQFGLKQGSEYKVLDIGCGGGDTIKAVDRWAKKHSINLAITGLDSSSTAIAFAKDNCSHLHQVSFVCSPFQSFTPTEPFDIVMCSLFTHHLYNDDLHLLLKIMDQHSKLGFTINDLERNPLAYAGIRLLTQLFSSSYLVKHDAPLSVQRGFKRADWRALLKEAGYSNTKIDNVWAFRHAITYLKDV